MPVSSHRPRRAYLAALLASALVLPTGLADACTRVLYQGDTGTVITARSMDWSSPIGTNLYALPAGMERNGKAGPNSLTWTAKYGSVVATGYDVSTTDGINEAGLGANVLWLTESVYPEFGEGSKPGLTIAAWAQYVLDNFATVAEAVEVLRDPPFTIVTAEVPGQTRLTTLHLSLSDASGDSAIVEYIDGEPVIHHGSQYQVMTNSPIYDQQLALNSYWQQIGGTVMLPGTNRASDRFARAAFYVNAIPQDSVPDSALASMFGVIRNASVPLGISTPDQPEISSTLWRTVMDHNRKLYFFESAVSPNTFWVNLNNLDLSAETGTVKRLDLGPDLSTIYSGEASGDFVEADPFVFLGL